MWPDRRSRPGRSRRRAARPTRRPSTTSPLRRRCSHLQVARRSGGSRRPSHRGAAHHFSASGATQSSRTGDSDRPASIAAPHCGRAAHVLTHQLMPASVHLDSTAVEGDALAQPVTTWGRDPRGRQFDFAMHAYAATVTARADGEYPAELPLGQVDFVRAHWTLTHTPGRRRWPAVRPSLLVTSGRLECLCGPVQHHPSVTGAARPPVRLDVFAPAPISPGLARPSPPWAGSLWPILRSFVVGVARFAARRSNLKRSRRDPAPPSARTSLRDFRDRRRGAVP